MNQNIIFYSFWTVVVGLSLVGAITAAWQDEWLWCVLFTAITAMNCRALQVDRRRSAAIRDQDYEKH